MPKSKDTEFLISIYNYIEQYQQEHQRPPSSAEMIAAGFATSTSVIHYYYGIMERRGMIERDAGIARGVRLMPRESWTLTLPPLVISQQPRAHSDAMAGDIVDAIRYVAKEGE